MLFNSYEFIFAFLPATLAGFFLLGARSRQWALGWLTLASLFFYAWWRPLNVLIIAPSILINFFLARALVSLGERADRPMMARAVLIAGIVFNVCFLGYFKYVNFLAGVVNDVTGTNFVLDQVILPLGISFITFQKIAFLIDVHAKRVRSFDFRDYSLFVLFFPQLIAGPIVHYREMMPQFHAASCRFNREDCAVGLTLFVFGLFKKVVLADGIAEYVSPVYGAAAAGQTISLLPAWIAALGFTLQIYFDFSGYSDMALGLGRFFGIRLPANFDSPLKATNIIDYWARWHMTLTRFLTAYLYTPLVLWLTRRRLAQGRAAGMGRNVTLGAFAQLLVAPTLLTMLVSGTWHGAGYTFVLWGLLHGVYLSINQAWRQFGPRALRENRKLAALTKLAGFIITFAAVVAAMVLFRASSVHDAGTVYRGMLGMNGVIMPEQIYNLLAKVLPHVQNFVGLAGSEIERSVLRAALWVFALLVIALAFPNSLQIVARYSPTINYKPRPSEWRFGFLGRAYWRPSFAWTAGVGALASVVVIQLGAKSEFLYWQF